MEEIKEQSCSVGSKKCCAKSITIIIICSLLCFFLGYYFGSKTNSGIKRNVGPGINRPFPSRPPKVPNRIPNIPKIQRPPAQRIPQTSVPPKQPQRINSQLNTQSSTQANSETTAKKTTNKK